MVNDTETPFKEGLFFIHYQTTTGVQNRLTSNQNLIESDICTLIDYGYEIASIERIS